MAETLKIGFKGWLYQYHMDSKALKIPSQRGPSWVNNLDWEQAVGAEGRFLPTDELIELYAGAGITPDSPVVTYCYIGVRAAHTWFVLSELLDYPDVALYDGSWSEYGTTEGVEIET